MNLPFATGHQRPGTEFSRFLRRALERFGVPVVAAAFAAAPFVPAAVAAQAYPVKPVRVYVPASPGGASDVAARLIGAKLTEQFGQPFVVENRVSSGGMVATEQFVRAPPDGYTILIAFDTFSTNPFLYPSIHYDVSRDFAPVTLIARYPQVLVAHPGLGVHSLAEFIAYAKRSGSQLNYGSAGAASSSRLAYELFKRTAGIESTPVHYRGGSPAINDLLAGVVQVMLVQAGGTIQQSVRAGKLVALATSGPSRTPLLPEVPAIAESYPGFETVSWVGLLAPAGTPRGIIDRLHDAVAGVLASDEMKVKFAAQGGEIVASSPAQFAAFIASESAKWGKLIRDLHIAVDRD